MSENAVQQNPYHAALVATQEAYLGEVLGKFLDAEAKLRLANLRIKELNDRLTLADQQAEQLKEAQKALNAMTSNKSAFEDKNTTLMQEISAIRVELLQVKKERQEAMERELYAKEELSKLTQRRRKKEAVNGKHDTAQAI